MKFLRGMIERKLRKIVSEYLENLPPMRLNKIVSALDLTDSAIKRMIDEAKGDKTIEIIFKSGDVAVIRSVAPATRGGPGW